MSFSPIRQRFWSRFPLLLTVASVVALSSVVFSLLMPAFAANPDGDLHIEINAAYNLVVDSNVESPSTYAPESFYIGAQFCNDGGNDLTNVVVNVGDFDEGGSNHVPGIYPARASGDGASALDPYDTGRTFDAAHPHLAGTPGVYQFTHVGDANTDATRLVGTIPAGDCVTQYWLVSYPRRGNLSTTGDNLGDAVWGATRLYQDDLWLAYDVWATANDGGATLTANQTRVASLRNEISAMANKIWPNGDNKVPEVYKNAIAAFLGWDTLAESGNNAAYPGETIRLEGVWYDLGNANHGFDNDGDFVPDQNAWMQPVGDPELYKPECFRLIHTYGLVIVKLVGGGEYLIPFEDQLYFENLPENTGVVGLVFYEYLALNGACTANISPYQEVASGADNEKFNGDYGHYVPPLISLAPDVLLDKSVDKTQVGPTLPETLDYTLAFTNTGPVAVGNIDYNMPLVLRDSIPAGTTYSAGSATASVNGGAIGTTIYFSTDNGTSWSTAEPGDPTTVTDIQWWLMDRLPASGTGTVSFQISVSASYGDVVVPNTGSIGFGNSLPFADDTVYTFLKGTNSIGDLVWQDEDNSGSYDSGTEAGIDGVGLSLYWDQNGNGTLDDSDQLFATQSTSTGGSYLFDELPDGDFLVVVDSTDPDLPTGYTATTNETISVLGLSGTYLDADFGFGPPLTIDKSVLTSPVYEGQEVLYQIDITNNRPSGTGTACTFDLWAAASASQSDTKWVSLANAIGSGGPDGIYATSDFQQGQETLGGTDFAAGVASGTIVKVEAIYSLYVDGPLDNDVVVALLYFDNDTTEIASTTFVKADIDPFGTNSGAQGLLTWDVTATRTWDWADFSGNLDLILMTDKVGADDNVILSLDALGFRVTTDATCGGDTGYILGTVPLTDTYNADLLEFVSADPVADELSFTTAPYANTGVINWANVGPIDGQETKTVTVTFTALEPAGNVSTPVTNTAYIRNATFRDGSPANDDDDDAPATIIPTGSIAGTLWSEGSGGSAGWINVTTGYESGTDRFIPAATVELYGCTDGSGNPLDPTGVNTNKICTANGGVWELLDTETTDTNGDYLFAGLRNGFYYVQVDETSIPGTPTRTAEAGSGVSNQNGTGRTCGTCDGIWGDPAANLRSTTFNPIDSASEDITNINFGYNVLPAIAGTVWHDHDGDGTRDLGDEGLTPPTVTLNGSDSSSTTVTVDSDGNFLFEDLTSGVTYTIIVNTGTLPGSDPWTQTAETDSTINNQITLTPQAGEILTGNDFGFHQTGTATIGDTLFYDWNGDGTQGASDEGIANVTMKLYNDADGNGLYDDATDALVATTSTDSVGFYQFTDLPAGDYVVTVDIDDSDFPATSVMSADPDEADICVACDDQGAVTNLTSGANVDTVDFGYRLIGEAVIGDTVFYDANGDGTQGLSSEIGLSGVSVSLWADLNGDGTFVLVATTTTNGNGEYLFTGLIDGSYQVIVDESAAAIADNNYVASTVTGYTAVISGGAVTSLNSVSCTDCDLDADFGFMPLGSIGDLIFWDANGNGEPDYNDPGIDGVTVTLTNDSAMTDRDGVTWAAGTYVTTTVTSDGSDGNPVGFYLFENLTPADYTVSVNPAAAPIGGAAQTADPDRDGVACDDNTYPSMPVCDDEVTVTIAAGTNFMGADLGYQPSGVVGDYVWFDQNGDGVQDSGEIGLVDLLVAITNGGETYTMTTDFNGEYSFSNLGAGIWTITVEQPASMTGTDDPDGSPDNTTTVVIDGSGTVTTLGGSACTDCELNADFGYEMDGPFALTGVVCLEPSSSVSRVCDDPTDVPVTSYNVVLYNDAGQYLGATTTDATGHYTFTNLIADTYYVAMSTVLPPLDAAGLTTTAADTPATTVSDTGVSAFQEVTVDGTAASSDGGVDANMVEKVDFAYVLTIDYDYGDLPSTYSTSLLNGPSGPRHSIPGGPTLYLGANAPDAEDDGAPSALADSDGTDEDGVVAVNITSWSDGTNGGTVQVTVNGSGHLLGWIDFNGDGDLTDTGEMIINQAVSAGQSNFSFDIPAGTISGGNTDFYSRFRLFESAPLIPALAYVGAVTNGEVEDYLFAMATPTPTSTPTATPTATATSTATATATSTATATATNTPLPTNTPTATATSLPTNTPTATATDTPLPTNTPTATATETPLPTNTPTATATDTPLPTNTPTATATETPLPTNTPTATATDTPLPTNTPTATVTNTPLPTNTPTATVTNTPLPTNTPTATATDTPLPTNTPTATVTNTPLPTNTPTATATDTPLPTNTPTATATDTPLPTNTPTATATDTPLPTNTPTATATDTPLPTNTPTATATDTPLPTNTPTATATDTPLPTNTPTATATDTPLPTNTPTATATDTPLPTNTPTATATDTPLPTNTPTATATDTPLPTNTPTATATDTPLPTNTPTATATDTPLPTNAPTATATDTPLPTNTPTATATDTPLPTNTPTATATDTPLPTNTPTATATDTPLPTATPLSLSMGDSVWHDRNNNGLVDEGEEGIVGVTVQLFRAGDDPTSATPIATVVTDDDGRYQFDNLLPGNYFIYIPTPHSSYPWSSTPTDSADNQEDNDDNGEQPGGKGTAVRSPVIALTTLANQTVDFGFFAPASIGELVWLDVDTDGVQDALETGWPDTPHKKGVAGVRVALYTIDGTLVQTTTTTTSGYYYFGDLLPGSYYVQFAIPNGYELTQPDATEATDIFDSDVDLITVQTPVTTLASGEHNPTLDMGLYLSGNLPPAAIGEQIWYDANGNGLQDMGEIGIPGIGVTLYHSDGTPIATTQSDSTGFYEFNSLPAGEYYLEFDLPDGYLVSPQNVGDNQDLDSDVDAVTGQTALINLSAGELDSSWSLGLSLAVESAAIGDRAWFDANVNGIQDENELGVPGVQVTLYQVPTITVDSNVAVVSAAASDADAQDRLVAKTMTDADGRYRFENLAPGTYYLVFAPPAGYTPTSADLGVDDSVDSDADVVSGQTAATVLEAGETDLSWDYGLWHQTAGVGLSGAPATLGDYVWIDANNDGFQDPGERPAGGVTVILYNKLGELLAIDVTDGDGHYQFASLLPGSYFIEFVTPVGYLVSPIGADATGVYDSDADPSTGRTPLITASAGESSFTWDAGIYIAPTALDEDEEETINRLYLPIIN